MPQPLADALAELRPLLLDPQRLVRAVAAGRRRGHELALRRAQLRPVDLKTGRRLQVVTYDERQATTRNASYGAEADRAVDELLALPFGNWHVETDGVTVQLRVTKKGEAQVHRSAGVAATSREHDRAKSHLLDPADPLFDVVGGGADKRRQVDAFLRLLDPAVAEAVPPPAPLTLVDLGCGNAYLTFAAHRFLTVSRHRDVSTTGVDVKTQARDRNTKVAAELGVGDRVGFVEGTILDAPAGGADVVLALHACDTATDEALARAVGWDASLVLAAPCCHHDVQRQLRETQPPAPYAVLTRQGILRERFADVLTDAVRAAVLRLLGYRVEVVEFIDSAHTPRNLLIRAVRTGAAPEPGHVAGYLALVRDWGIRPRLAELLADRLDPVLSGAGG